MTDHVILTLETVEKARQYVKVNGEMVPITNVDELGSIQQYRMSQMVEQVQPLLAKADTDDITEDEVLTLDAMLNELVGYILPTLDADLLKRSPVDGGLSDQQKVQIIQAFTELVGPQSEPARTASGKPAKRRKRSKK